MREKELELISKRKERLEGASYEKQRAKGKLNAKERIDLLFDEGTFQEISLFSGENPKYPGDGVIIGYGKIDGKAAFCSSQDFSVRGGSLGRVQANKIITIMDYAYKAHAPYISLIDSGGARIEEGVVGLNGYGDIFSRSVKYSGKIPQIAVILGPAAGGASYSPALMDAVFLCKPISLMFLTGPEVAKAVLFQDYEPKELGGWETQVKESGVGHFAYEDEKSCLLGVRKFLSYIPSFNPDPVPFEEPDDKIDSVLPKSARQSYDVRKIIASIVDKDSFFEIHDLFARNCVTGFARIGGGSIGIVANQPCVLSGSIDYNAAGKIGRFVKYCNKFSMPVVTLVDVPAFMPGLEQEKRGIIRAGAMMIESYCSATVPMVTLIMRKAYGGAYIAMGSKSLGADFVYAWPEAEIAVMGAEGSISILHRHEIKGMGDEEIEKLRENYEKEYSNPYHAEKAMLVDEVILHSETRDRIKKSLAILREKGKSFT